MLRRLRHRKALRRFTLGSKGFSSIVGAVFAALVMISLISTVFVWSLSQNTLYNNAVRQSNQADLDRKAENLQCLNTTYTIYNDTKDVNVNAGIQNLGSTSVQFVSLWVCVSTSIGGTPWTGYNLTSLKDVIIQPGSVYWPNINLTISGLNPTYSYRCSSWLITARGNTVALEQRIISSNLIISAEVAQGIGSVAMDFKAFRYFDLGPSSVANGTILPSPKFSYTIPNTNNTIFAMQLTNWDETTQAITLNSNSYVWIITPQASTVKPASWKIANVTSGRYINSFSTVTLPWGEPVTVYFGPSSPSFAAGTVPTVVPVFILLFGKIGSVEFGQNIPFVAFNIPA